MSGLQSQKSTFRHRVGPAARSMDKLRPSDIHPGPKTNQLQSKGKKSTPHSTRLLTDRIREAPPPAPSCSVAACCHGQEQGSSWWGLQPQWLPWPFLQQHTQTFPSAAQRKGSEWHVPAGSGLCHMTTRFVAQQASLSQAMWATAWCSNQKITWEDK